MKHRQNRSPIESLIIAPFVALAIYVLLILFAPNANAQGVIINGEATATLTWTPPTTNEDGSPLTDLEGYVLYWDTQSGVGRCSEYPTTRLDPCYANALDLTDGSQSSQGVTLNLNADTTVYFSIIAYNTQGVMSKFSGEALKEFTLVVTTPPDAPVIQSIDLTIICTTDNPQVTCTFDVQ